MIKLNELKLGQEYWYSDFYEKTRGTHLMTNSNTVYCHVCGLWHCREHQDCKKCPHGSWTEKRLKDAAPVNERLAEFAATVERQQIERLYGDNLACETNVKGARVSIKAGAKYTKVDVGSSGKFMVDAAGNIFGIKAYGVIHKGHQYGTLDTINEWYWGLYAPVRRTKR